MKKYTATKIRALVNCASINPTRPPILKKNKIESMIPTRTGKDVLKRLMPLKTSSGAREIAYKTRAAEKRIMSLVTMVSQKAFFGLVKIEINYKFYPNKNKKERINLVGHSRSILQS